MGSELVGADLVVVGGGVAGLLAATLGREHGLDVILLESTGLLGGSTAADTGQVYLPATHHATSYPTKAAGEDTPAEALAYLNAVLGDATPASSAARREAFVGTAARVARWLEDHKVPLAPARGTRDFHPDAPGARRGGRVLSCGTVNRRALGAWADRLRTPEARLQFSPRSGRGLVLAMQAVAHRVLHPTKDAVTGGAALAAALVQRALAAGVVLWVDAPVTELIDAGGRVRGVRVLRDGVEVEVSASRGVLLACGGFEGSAELRRRHLPCPTDVAWTTGLASNDGFALTAALAAGAAAAELGEAWWTPVALFGGRAYRMTNERSAPHSLIVDSAGDRFLDEADPTPQAGRALYARHRGVRAIPSWLIVDDRHRQRYRLGPWLPGSAPRGNDVIVKATSLNDLAVHVGVDRPGLIGTVVRFNGFAKKGHDADFGRGGRGRGTGLGSLEKSPFWAVPLYPGDAGTKGGALVDADARVLTASGEPIPGLFAAGGAAASLFRGEAPGSGAAGGTALVEAYRAVTAMGIG